MRPVDDIHRVHRMLESLGAPTNPQVYDLTFPDYYPEETRPPADRVREFRELCCGLRLLTWQVKVLWSWLLLQHHKDYARFLEWQAQREEEAASASRN